MVGRLLISCLLSLVTVKGAKILIIPPDHHSNANCFAVAGAALVEAGHEVDFLTVSRHRNLLNRHTMRGLYFQPTNYTSPTDDMEFMNTVMSPLSFLEMIAQWNKLIDISAGLCHQMLADEQLNSQIAAARYDVALVESNDIVRCLSVIPYRHEIPYISLGIRHDPWTARVSASPSAEGQFGLHPFADPYNPTLTERLMAVLTEIVFYAILPPPQMNDDFITKYAPNRPAVTMRELHQMSEIHFINMETCCLDTPRVSAPHYIYLGGIGTEPGKPLNAEFSDLANKSTNGLIVVTFGSAIKTIPLYRMEAMMGAFRQIPQQVVMRYIGPLPSDLPKNVKLSKWLPQNDLLAHPNTQLFISHCGGNGQMEALYHGVPLVCIPIMDEQTYNSERALARGFATMLDFHTFTAGDLLDSVMTILNDSSYTQRIKLCSERYRFLPNPQKTLTFWVDHVIKHGGDHLKPPYVKMPIWHWFGLDILFICFILIHLSVKSILSGIRLVILIINIE